MSSSRDSSKKQHSGRRVGDFVIDKEIGKGSFAQVYLGWHKVWHTTTSPMHLRIPKSTKAYMSRRHRKLPDPYGLWSRSRNHHYNPSRLAIR